MRQKRRDKMPELTRRQVRDYMLDSLSDHVMDTGGIDLTTLAEDAAQHFDGDVYDLVGGDDYFEIAFDVVENG